MVETREFIEEGYVSSKSTKELETLVPQRERTRSREEVQESRPVRRRRTRYIVAAEASWVKWANIEENIEFPILRPRTNAAPQEPIAEEPQIEGLWYENGLLKEEVQAFLKELESWKEKCRK